MCVILACESKFPSEETLNLAEECNGDGGGMAWLEKGKVRWQKGIDAKGVISLIKKPYIKLPVMIHFRIATIGGVNKELTHPFVLDPEVGNPIEGVTEKGVLMHNGHWSGWNDALFHTIIGGKLPAPKGLMSDSRAMSLVVARYGPDILKFFPSGSGKVSILTPNGMTIYGTGWHDKTKEEGYYQSSFLYDRKCVVTYPKEAKTTHLIHRPGMSIIKGGQGGGSTESSTKTTARKYPYHFNESDWDDWMLRHGIS